MLVAACIISSECDVCNEVARVTNAHIKESRRADLGVLNLINMHTWIFEDIIPTDI